MERRSKNMLIMIIIIIITIKTGGDEVATMAVVAVYLNIMFSHFHHINRNKKMT